MDFFYFMLIVGVVVGAMIVLYAFLSSDDDEVVKKKEIDAAISEVDETIAELNDTSRTIMKEFDYKYQELLFLYNLIDEKKKALVTFEEEAVLGDEAGTGAIEAIFQNPKIYEILQLQKRGLSVSEIAKTLEIGQGEVSMIISLAGETIPRPRRRPRQESSEQL